MKEEGKRRELGFIFIIIFFAYLGVFAWEQHSDWGVEVGNFVVKHGNMKGPAGVGFQKINWISL